MKGITRRADTYIARVQVGDIRRRRSFSTPEYNTIAEAYIAATEWLLQQQEDVRQYATGMSKYRIREDIILTQELLKEHLHYNQDTGVFTWVKPIANSLQVGDLAGCYDGDGYRIISLYNKPYKAHRLAFLYMEGVLPPEDIDVDHIDRIASNNAWNNLRLATRSQNQFNSVTKTGISGIKGVTFIPPNKWRGNVQVKGSVKAKLFFTIEEAANWVRETREELHEEFTNHG